MKRRLTTFGGRAVWLCLFFVLTQCGRMAPQNIFMLSTPTYAKFWKSADIPDAGKVTFTPSQRNDGEIELQPGQPMTGATFDAKKWQTAQMPVTRYSIEYEAMRVEGNDFFGTVTFPVYDSHVSLIVGGWGGTLVGISSIDDMDASENTTRGNGYFENNRWHKVRIEVRDDGIQAWINNKLFVNVSIRGHKLGLRSGDIEKCAPFGFASYATEARIRNVLVRRL